MYECRGRRSTSLGGLGFSLKPPAWLLQPIEQTFQQIEKGVSLNVPTPVGPVKLTLPQAQAAARGASVSYNPPTQGTLPQQVAQTVENIPGGWATVIGVGLLLGFFVFRGGRR